jgi:arylsulfatase A-like enzyme
MKLRSTLVLLLAGMTAVELGCRRTADLPDPKHRLVVRLIEPETYSPVTASLQRVELGSESRYAVAPSSALTLRRGDPVELPESGDLRVDVDLAGEGTTGVALRLDGWISVVKVEKDKARAKPLAELFQSNVTILRAEPLVSEPPAAHSGEADAGRRETLTFSIPDGLRGQPASLDVVARPLPAEPVQRIASREVTIPPDSRLEFGYGVEEPGWDEGWPPVRFEVVAAMSAPGSDRVALFDRRIDPARDTRDRRWFDASVDLSDVAGSRVRFTFTAEAITGTPGTTIERSFAVYGTPEIVPSPAATPQARPPNVVLISLDTLRARSVSAYGHTRRTTPALDHRLAARGALVRFAVTPAPYTPPAHMTMLTGLEPCVHDVHGNLALSPEHVTITEILRAEGYRTAAFTEDGLLLAGAGFDRGFDTYVENRSAAEDPALGRETFAAAERWVERNSRPPFFLFVHTYQVHAPYAAPRGYGQLYGDGPRTSKRDVTEALYDREVRYTDDLLAGFLDTLARRGLEAQTIVVVTSDHGEGFGEHFWFGHGFDLHDEALLVPLIVRAPGLVRAGTIVEKQVGLVDLAPTLLELVGAQPPSGIQGRSFAAELTGRGPAFDERPLVSYLGDGSAYAIRTPGSKYIQRLRNGAIVGERYYDLTSDPGETRNLAARGGTEAARAGDETGAAIAAARRELEAVRAACDSWRRKHLASQDLQDRAIRYLSPRSAPRGFVMREEVMRKLRSLGYLE